MFLVLDVERFFQDLLDIIILDLYLASIICTFQWEFILTNLSTEGFRKAIFMKNVLTILQRNEVLLIEANIADLADCFIISFIYFGLFLVFLL